MFKTIVAVCVGALALVGCAKLTPAIQSGLGAVCPVAAQTHAGFLAANAGGKFNKYAKSEAQAYAALSVACADPSAVNATNVAVYIGAALAAWEAAGLLSN